MKGTYSQEFKPAPSCYLGIRLNIDEPAPPKIIKLYEWEYLKQDKLHIIIIGLFTRLINKLRGYNESK
jgi:hypothetical protein